MFGIQSVVSSLMNSNGLRILSEFSHRKYTENAKWTACEWEKPREEK